ncbi:hypothetical protein HK103_000087 [Boothiomyces macroporosus]|uniref:NDT80 domain-containing protein n=1 Tax=Boothiomyces macroporosus TaxID=261099 RepID=A0AAD5UN11_9FUNG|nr:hypothetical protein HK103_000087 [Boothiomyces macroporosus]
MPKKTADKKSYSGTKYRKAAGLKINTALNSNAARVAKKEKPINSPKKRSKESYLDTTEGLPDFGPTLTIELQPSMSKFFKSKVDQTWVCYRRNYFSVSCKLFIKDDHNMYTPHPYFLYDRAAQVAREILRFEYGVEAKVVDGKKNISIDQHNAKRDKRQPVVDMPVSPNPEPKKKGYDDKLLNTPKLERLMFKSATQNSRGNKQQQFFQLVVVLYCVIIEEVQYDPLIYGPIKDKDGNHVKDAHGNPFIPNFIEIEKKIRVATKESVPFIVRGRSPGHYKDDDGYTGNEEEETQEIPDSNTEYPESMYGNQESIDNPPTSNDILSETLGPSSAVHMKDNKLMGPPTTPASPNNQKSIDENYGGACLWNDLKSFSVGAQPPAFQSYSELPLSSYSRKLNYSASALNQNGPLSAPLTKAEFFGDNQRWQYNSPILASSMNPGTPIVGTNIPTAPNDPIYRSTSGMLPGTLLRTPQLSMGSPPPNLRLSQSFGNFSLSESQVFDSGHGTQFESYSQDQDSFGNLSKDVIDALQFNYPNLQDSMNMDN